MSYKSFKNELENYEEYQKNAESLREEISDIFYSMTGVKGVPFDRIPGSFNPSLIESRKLEMIDLYNQKLEDLKHYEMSIRYVDRKLKDLTAAERQMCFDVASGKITYEVASKQYGYSKGRMWKKVKQILEEIL